MEWEIRGRYGVVIEKGVGVFNGDTGILREINEFAETAEVEFEDGRFAMYSFKQLEELELAYAITIHKSQGSESDSSESISRVLDGTVDLALVGQNTRDESCVFIPFCHDELVIATPVTDHYLALKDRETPTIFHDFLKDSIILREKGSGTKKEMDLFLERTGVTTGNLNVIARMNDLESIKKSIVNGLGISILSSRSVNDLQRTKQILVFPLEEAAHKRSFYIVYSKNRILKPHVKQFVQFVRDYYM